MTRHLLTASDLSRDDATAILDDADRFAQALMGREVRKLPTLRGRTVITMFYENSTRTRVSFEVAGKWMSADVINVSASGSSVGKGESLRDTALTLRAMVAKGAMPPLVLAVTDCRASYAQLKARGVEFTQEPVDRYGSVDAGFRDPAGNGWKMIETPKG